MTACGSSSGNSSSGGGGDVATKAPAGAKHGGTLTVLQLNDVDYIDPGAAYYQGTYMITSVTQRSLYGYKPGDALPTPDFAAALPDVSSDGKTATIKIRHGVRFSPPVNREANAQDAAYALQRAFTPGVPNAYFPTYLASLEGLKAFQDGKAKSISGIQTPDDWTLVLKFTKPVAGYVTASLSLPAAAPVPEEYAKKFDAHTPSTYGEHQVATGPYMIRNDASGAIVDVGWHPKRSMELVRNPNWDPKTDYRPAYLDKVEIKEGVDANVGGRQVLTGSHMVYGEPPPAPIVRLAATRYKDQITFVPGTGSRYVSLRTDRAPFDNVNLRKAVAAALPKNALRLTRGGAAVGDLASHFITPGEPGFEESGGMKGPDLDFMQQPNGNMQLAASYLKQAGYPSGKYTGPPITMVGDNGDPAQKTAQVVLETLQKLGFKVQYRSVEHATMYTKFCSVPAQEPDVCPNVGWIKDFNDGLNNLDIPFNGESIVKENNANWPLFDDKKINAEIDAAKQIADPAARAKAAGRIDDEIAAMAPAIPWLWDKQASIESGDVNGVIGKWNGTWDYSFTSLK